MKVFLFLNDESPEEKNFLVQGEEGFGNPHVHFGAKVNAEDDLPAMKSVMEDYFLRLEFQKEEDGEIPGRIFFQAPDDPDTKIAGTFRMTIETTDVPATTDDDGGDR